MERILFTDLDGTLLDHYSYDFLPAMPAIKALAQEQIPWVLTTSKTAAELIPLKQTLHNPYPCIIENGAAILGQKADFELFLGNLHQDEYSLEGDFAQLKQQWALQAWQAEQTMTSKEAETWWFAPLGNLLAAQIKERLQQFKTQYQLKFTSFAQLSVTELMELTGLAQEQAQQAKERLFSEPILWQDSPAKLAVLAQACQQQGLQLLKGGRFYHVLEQANVVSKGLALQFLAQHYSQAWQQAVQTLALGDGDNDIPMLRAADTAVLIRSPVNAFPELEHNKLIKTKKTGPQGWNSAVLDWLQSSL